MNSSQKTKRTSLKTVAIKIQRIQVSRIFTKASVILLTYLIGHDNEQPTAWGRLNSVAKDELYKRSKSKFFTYHAILYLAVIPCVTAHDMLQKVYTYFLLRLSRRHQFHIVRTELEPGYYDIDYRLLYASFALFCEHVEEEHTRTSNHREALNKLENEIATSGVNIGPDQLSRLKCMRDLYKWWRFDRVRIIGVLKKIRSGWYPKPDEEIALDLNIAFYGSDPSQSTHNKYAYIRRAEEALYNKDTDMLVSLVRIRSQYWT